MIASQFSDALEAHQSYQLGRYLDQLDDQDRFDAELEREMRRLGSMPLDEALEEMGLTWDTAITGSLQERLGDVISSRVDDPY